MSLGSDDINEARQARIEREAANRNQTTAQTAPAPAGRTGPVPADQVEQVRAIIDGPGHDHVPAVPAVCGAACPGGTCERAPHGPQYPHIAQAKYARHADAGLPGAPSGPVDLWSAEWPYPQLGPADFAALYRTAAEIIRARGYYAHECQGYADEPGISVCGALKAAALEREQAADPQGKPENHYRDAANLAEDLETRLAAVLYLLGQIHTRTGIRDLSDIVASWELAHHHLGPGPVLADAVTLLDQAAALFGQLADTSAPVTAAPGPQRLDGCTCAAPAGSHTPPCPWSAGRM